MILVQMRKIVEGENIPVFGVGPVCAMANEKPGHRPEDLLPGAQSLICFGLLVPSQVYHMPNYRVETVWRSQNLYYCRLDMLSIRFTLLLEEKGEKAAPAFGCMPLGMNEKGVIVGFLNQIRMGEVTGIGVIGKNGLLINSLFGSRLMFGGVLTIAELPEIRYPEINKPGCPPDCQICVDACPVDALMQNRKQVMIMRCLGYTARAPFMSRARFLFLRAFNPKAAARYMNLTAFDEHTFHICSN